MIFRIEKTKDYTVMANYHLREKDMSLKAKGLLSWMLSNTDDWDYSIQGIVNNCKEKESSILTTLKELSDFGYLEINKLMPESYENENGEKIVIRSRISYEYIIHEKPISLNQQYEIQPLENLPVEVQPVENPVQINTKAINTKISNTNKQKNNSKELLENFQFGGISKRKHSLYSNCLSILNSYDFSKSKKIRSMLTQYLQYRIQIKDKPLYTNMWKGMLNKLQQICVEDENLYESVIQQSIERGYLSFYPVASENTKSKTIRDIEGDIKSNSMTEEDYKELARVTEERRRLGLQAEF